jgi:hypothetical protein
VSTSSSPPSELYNGDNFLHSSSIKSECDMELKNNIMIGEHSFRKDTEEKKRRKLSKDSSSEEDHKNEMRNGMRNGMRS